MKGNPENPYKNAAAEAEAMLKRGEALKLRREGKTYQQIADLIGYSGKSMAYREVQAALHETIREAGPEVRELEVQRLDLLVEKLLPYALGSAEEQEGVPSLHTVDRLLKVMERRAKLLGLDAPVRQDITVAERKADPTEALFQDEDGVKLVADLEKYLADHGHVVERDD